MHERKIWELAGKINAGEATESEKEELHTLLLVHPEVGEDIEIIAGFWNYRGHKSESDLRHHVYEKLMLQIQKEPGTNKRRKIGYLKRHVGYAAAVMILLTSAAVIFRIVNVMSGDRHSKTIVAARGTKSHLTLPDGSKVWMNAGSTLRYNPVSHGDSTREVFLSGEAYFEVVHREDHPFVIHTSHVDIKDLGTSFNVRAYPGEGFSETTLIEGSVEIIHKNKERSLLNGPHQKVTVFDSGDNIRSNAQVSNSRQLIPETAWMNGVLIFKNETFQHLAVRMERYYDINVTFEAETLRSRRITGSFSNETLEQALNTLQQIIKFHYDIDGRRVRIYK